MSGKPTTADRSMNTYDFHRSLPPEVREKIQTTRMIVARLAPTVAAGTHGRLDRNLIKALGDAGVLAEIFPSDASVSAVTLCALREGLAGGSTAAETAFALQGLGSYPIVQSGSDALRERWIPGVARGEVVAGFALTEPDAGTDAAALSLSAARVDGGFRLSGTKKWISNAPDADVYSLF